MSNWKRVDLLEIVEAYAADNGLIDSEEALSEKFDDEVAPSVIAKYGEDDTMAMNEEFNIWSDNLANEGLLHREQCNNYTYEGRRSRQLK